VKINSQKLLQSHTYARIDAIVTLKVSTRERGIISYLGVVKQSTIIFRVEKDPKYYVLKWSRFVRTLLRKISCHFMAIIIPCFET
jgi:hypothetical protein